MEDNIIQFRKNMADQNLYEQLVAQAEAMEKRAKYYTSIATDMITFATKSRKQATELQIKEQNNADRY